MAISSLLFVPDKGMDKILNNLVPVLNNLEKDAARETINKLVLTSDIETLKSFYFLNNFMYSNFMTFRNDEANNHKKIRKFVELVLISMNKLLGISSDIDIAISDKSFPKIKSIFTGVTINAKTDYPELHMYKKLVKNRININSIFKSTYTIPKGNTTLLIVVVDQDKYLSLITSLIDVIKDIATGTLISNYYLLDIAHKITSLFFNDILKQEIVKQPEIGVVIVDNKYAKLNKSYLYSVL